MMTGLSFTIATELAAISDPRQARMLGDYAAHGGAMLGVIRIGVEGTNGFWERHDGGDELLVVVSGRMTMTLRPESGPDLPHDLGPGDALLIPRGVAHTARLHTPEVRLLFVTPREGNAAWTDHPEGKRRH
ncbi:cupin domain-containing protein [Pyxidicoccus fallax]|uniref:Cupin domain-containing protein n=1 Tax=Pyxidicoccus fallax TaxID=394095 RepID=A0A848LNF4_9BACT|nr:cupin domain-containing protein [Pyxidicoccus fallax]NMO19387.1 cupin domain-containing protein [Pyxidicoccus fallax]NPC80237.1 cupin domain-containing protein [Pyxidicoccus fallax]